MNLSDEQINSLFAFTEKRGVPFYDLQVELVDHLATEIELAMAADGTLAFTAALNKAYSSFGVAGFDDVMKEKRKAAAAKERKMLWHEARQWLCFNRLLLLLSAGALFSVSGAVGGPALRVGFVIAVSVGLFAWLACILFAGKSTKDLLLLQYNCVDITCLPVAFFFVILVIETWKAVETQPAEIIIGPVLLFFALQITLCNVRRRLKKEAQRLYPKAFAQSPAERKV